MRVRACYLIAGTGAGAGAGAGAGVGLGIRVLGAGSGAYLRRCPHPRAALCEALPLLRARRVRQHLAGRPELHGAPGVAVAGRSQDCRPRVRGTLPQTSTSGAVG
eukprot:37692-Prorocentrum_minimum.AAC.1